MRGAPVSGRDEVLRSKVEEIDERGDGLTEWEVGFIGGLVDDPPERYTDRQAEVIDRIWRERV